jgi:hypothetical protein
MDASKVRRSSMVKVTGVRAAVSALERLSDEPAGSNGDRALGYEFR